MPQCQALSYTLKSPVLTHILPKKATQEVIIPSGKRASFPVGIPLPSGVDISKSGTKQLLAASNAVLPASVLNNPLPPQPYR